MRHRVYGKHLSRNKNQRTALFKSLVRALFINEKIQTTETKAKAIKGLVDKIITQAKSPTTRRLVSQFLIDKAVEEKLLNVLLPKLESRNSGYTSVVKLGPRLGDGATMVAMSLLTEEKVVASKKAEVVEEVKEAPKKESKPKAKTGKAKV